MSRTTVASQRPLSPHLTIYRWPITMTLSIAHRITGGALYVGTLLVAWWLVAAATSPDWFATANAVMGSIIGKLVLLGYTWAMFLHAVGGVRHMLWDTGVAMEKQVSRQTAWASLIASVVLTALTWIALYLVL
ncbi:succinate dehydrogenase, cytochrome b556 subunit [Tianweitania sp. BSSL-BM11]|uniref:Succinate dehydrogenase cytochrome b556 subunit n=1 Tax=Tianweitania aestuarii TaxID=2814886 RepID=A0ABS5S179_9HYPH|nr:succinate dehydrogenase, cytochrome b556 subunit [Tianweitania aestuarii]MBS9722234.1 succinate dehydrogenase, cytochrome b556 subunit [Tianweitania aestuarii]